MHIGRLLFLAPVLVACAAPVEGSPSSSPEPDPRSSAEPDEPSGADICEHVMNVMEREMGEAATTPTEEEISKFLAECAKEMVLEREKMADDEEFFRQARCVMAAQTMAEMEKCEDPAPQAP